MRTRQGRCSWGLPHGSTRPPKQRTATPPATARAQLRALHALSNRAFIAAICIARGVTELRSADRDFARFPAPRLRNPVVG
jgi:predicted nucleic acid-binding protein